MPGLDRDCVPEHSMSNVDTCGVTINTKNFILGCTAVDEHGLTITDENTKVFVDRETWSRDECIRPIDQNARITKHDPDITTLCWGINLHKRDSSLVDKDTSFSRAVDTDPCMVLVTIEVSIRCAVYGTPGHACAFDEHHMVAICRPGRCYYRIPCKERTTHILGAALVALVATKVPI